MNLGDRNARVVLFAATLGLVVVSSIGISRLLFFILTLLWLSLWGYLLGRGLLPRAYWPLRRLPGSVDLAISAACYVAALAFAIGVRYLHAHRTGMLACGVLMVIALCVGAIFAIRGLFLGPVRP
jgi:hypothetical protein